MNEPVVSVIVPFLDEELYLAQCIESLIDQDFAHSRYELLFVDNGSTDKSKSIVARFPEIRLLSESRPLVYAARNAAVAASSGAYLLFTDADCVVSRDWISTHHRLMAEDGMDMVLGKRFFAPDATHMARYMQNYEDSKIEFFAKRRNYRELYGYTNNMAIRRAVFDELGGFREDIPLADTEILDRYLEIECDPRIAYAPEASIEHLEIRRLADWVDKLRSYGAAGPQSGLRVEADPWDMKGAWKHCLQRHGYCWWQSALLRLCLWRCDKAFAKAFAQAHRAHT